VRALGGLEAGGGGRQAGEVEIDLVVVDALVLRAIGARDGDVAEALHALVGLHGREGLVRAAHCGLLGFVDTDCIDLISLSLQISFVNFMKGDWGERLF